MLNIDKVPQNPYPTPWPGYHQQAQTQPTSAGTALTVEAPDSVRIHRGWLKLKGCQSSSRWVFKILLVPLFYEGCVPSIWPWCVGTSRTNKMRTSRANRLFLVLVVRPWSMAGAHHVSQLQSGLWILYNEYNESSFILCLNHSKLSYIILL